MNKPCVSQQLRARVTKRTPRTLYMSFSESLLLSVPTVRAADEDVFLYKIVALSRGKRVYEPPEYSFGGHVVPLLSTVITVGAVRGAQGSAIAPTCGPQVALGQRGLDVHMYAKFQLDQISPIGRNEL
ncbi:hypothetical protein EVAR_97424_1 [Eumeta japonica]|uniref:Uncharacterized protein n=1 Tax=Eumeta variegata TaxID=151549 RepID=A0A4C1WYL9_EUMVA|nr:hypothetical protein EVAR_97424_1 [Eumeta japonica]